MKVIMNPTPSLLFLLLLALLFVPPIFADGDGGDGGGGGGGEGEGEGEIFNSVIRDPNMVEAVKLIAEKAWEPAMDRLQKVLESDPKNADALNLLGFSARNLGLFQEALAHYRAALDIKPGHRGVHEYLGETYLALNRLDKAREHLAFLDDDCWLPCDEFDDLKDAIERFTRSKGS